MFKDITLTKQLKFTAKTNFTGTVRSDLKFQNLSAYKKNEFNNESRFNIYRLLHNFQIQ